MRRATNTIVVGGWFGSLTTAIRSDVAATSHSNPEQPRVRPPGATKQLQADENPDDLDQRGARDDGSERRFELGRQRVAEERVVEPERDVRPEPDKSRYKPQEGRTEEEDAQESGPAATGRLGRRRRCGRLRPPGATVLLGVGLGLVWH